VHKINLEDKLKLIIAIIFAFVVIGSYFNLPDDFIVWIINFLISIFIGFILSAFAERIVEAFTGDYLKKILIPFKLFGIKFSISLFLIATIMVRILLFRM